MVVGAAYVIKICPINSIRSVFTPYGPYGAIHDSHQVQIPHVTLFDLHLESCFSLAALVSVLQLVWCSRGMHPSYLNQRLLKGGQQHACGVKGFRTTITSSNYNFVC